MIGAGRVENGAPDKSTCQCGGCIHCFTRLQQYYANSAQSENNYRAQSYSATAYWQGGNSDYLGRSQVAHDAYKTAWKLQNFRTAQCAPQCETDYDDAMQAMLRTRLRNQLCGIDYPSFTELLSRGLSREMTAEDLGLPLWQWDCEWVNNAYGFALKPVWMWLNRDPARRTDAPYAFWLGADA